LDHDTVCEGYSKDATFLGRRCDRPSPSFCIGRDVYAEYFLVVRSANGDLLPFWVVRVEPTQTQTLVTAIRFRFSIGCLILLNT
jgi:hypothetical protein